MVYLLSIVLENLGGFLRFWDGKGTVVYCCDIRKRMHVLLEKNFQCQKWRCLLELSCSLVGKWFMNNACVVTWNVLLERLFVFVHRFPRRKCEFLLEGETEVSMRQNEHMWQHMPETIRHDQAEQKLRSSIRAERCWKYWPVGHPFKFVPSSVFIHAPRGPNIDGWVILPVSNHHVAMSWCLRPTTSTSSSCQETAKLGLLWNHFRKDQNVKGIWKIVEPPIWLKFADLGSCI